MIQLVSTISVVPIFIHSLLYYYPAISRSDTCCLPVKIIMPVERRRGVISLSQAIEPYTTESVTHDPVRRHADPAIEHHRPLAGINLYCLV